MLHHHYSASAENLQNTVTERVTDVTFRLCQQLNICRLVTTQSSPVRIAENACKYEHRKMMEEHTDYQNYSIGILSTSFNYESSYKTKK